MSIFSKTIAHYISDHFPKSISASLRMSKKSLKKVKYNLTRILRPTIVNFEDLRKAFRIIGINSGDGVYIQSSMSSFGHIKGGTQTIITALEDIVGQNGLISMPAFPIVGRAEDYIKQGLKFDIIETPSNMGKITETFRRMPTVVRSLHPTHSVIAKGKDARSFVEGHEKCLTPFGDGSPFMKMIEKNMHLICFGVNIGYFTIYHTFEDLCGERFPFRVYKDQIARIVCIDENKKEKIVSTFLHDQKVSIRHIGHRPRKQAEIRHSLEASGKLRSTIVGKGEIICIRASDLISNLKSLLQKGITIYG